MKFRKKPIVIDAIQWDGTNKTSIEIAYEFGVSLEIEEDFLSDEKYLIIPTLEGKMKASPQDWIIKGVNGELYPCKPDIFEKTYDSVIEVVGRGKSEDGADSITVKVN